MDCPPGVPTCPSQWCEQTLQQKGGAELLCLGSHDRAMDGLGLRVHAPCHVLVHVVICELGVPGEDYVIAFSGSSWGGKKQAPLGAQAHGQVVPTAGLVDVSGELVGQ